MKRTIIKIDERKCNGCGECITGCHEGALKIIDGKARLVSELFCDGLGACIGTCPEGAITLEEREAMPYDEIAVMGRVVGEGDAVVIAHLRHLFEHNEKEYLKQGIDFLNKNNFRVDLSQVFEPVISKPLYNNAPAACPGSLSKVISINLPDKNKNNVESQLGNWPVQLHLINPVSQTFHNADLLLAADCTAFSKGDFHNLMTGKTLAIACPKLDSNKEVYVEKLVTMIDEANLNSITVAVMEVPCCNGLSRIVETALEQSVRKVPIETVVIGIGN